MRWSVFSLMMDSRFIPKQQNKPLSEPLKCTGESTNMQFIMIFAQYIATGLEQFFVCGWVHMGCSANVWGVGEYHIQLNVCYETSSWCDRDQLDVNRFVWLWESTGLHFCTGTGEAIGKMQAYSPADGYLPFCVSAWLLAVWQPASGHLYVEHLLSLLNSAQGANIHTYMNVIPYMQYYIILCA